MMMFEGILNTISITNYICEIWFLFNFLHNGVNKPRLKTNTILSIYTWHFHEKKKNIQKNINSILFISYPFVQTHHKPAFYIDRHFTSTKKLSLEPSNICFNTLNVIFIKKSPRFYT